MKKRGSIIQGTGSYAPEKILTNKDLERLVDTSDEWIQSRTGIKERRIAAKDETTSTLAFKASLRALEEAKMKGEELDLIIVATVTPDMFFPATACILQDMLGAKKAAAFDLEAGCTGFIYALTVAHQFIANGVYENALVVGAEILSRITDYEDRQSCILFGDGAGAVILAKTEGEAGFLFSELGSDGSGGDLLRLEGGGSLNPPTHDTVHQRLHFLAMEGKEVFKFAVRIMNKTSLALLKRAGLKREDLDFLVPHQANSRIIDSAAKRLNLSSHQIISNLERYGNTSSASIPMAFDEAMRKKMINKGDYVLLVGFGAGLTWGGCLIRMGERR